MEPGLGSRWNPDSSRTRGKGSAFHNAGVHGRERGQCLDLSLPVSSLPGSQRCHSKARRWHTIRHCWLCGMPGGGVALLGQAFLFLFIVVDFTDAMGWVYGGGQLWVAGLSSSCVSWMTYKVSAGHSHRNRDSYLLSFNPPRTLEPGEGPDTVHTNQAALGEGRACSAIQPWPSSSAAEPEEAAFRHCLQ